MLGINHFLSQTGNSQALSLTELLSISQRTVIISLTMGDLGGNQPKAAPVEIAGGAQEHHIFISLKMLQRAHSPSRLGGTVG